MDDDTRSWPQRCTDRRRNRGARMNGAAARRRRFASRMFARGGNDAEAYAHEPPSGGLPHAVARGNFGWYRSGYRPLVCRLHPATSRQAGSPSLGEPEKADRLQSSAILLYGCDANSSAIKASARRHDSSLSPRKVNSLSSTIRSVPPWSTSVVTPTAGCSQPPTHASRNSQAKGGLAVFV